MLHKLSKPRSARRHWILGGAGAFLLLLLALGLCAIPLLSVPGDAQAARREATAAVQALKAQDYDTARELVSRAREHVDETQGSLHGFGGDVWSLVPVVGGAVDDVRHLADALDDLTSVLEHGVDVYPRVVGDGATLISEGPTVDLDVLDEVITTAQDVHELTTDAEQALREVEADTPVIGGRLAEARDAAMEQVAPVNDALETVAPMLPMLPEILGADGGRTYLVAMLNPAEQHYSGGTPLTFAPMTFNEGRLIQRRTRDTAPNPDLFRKIQYQKVRGNDFHRKNQELRISSSTTAPSWSVAGHEMLNAWRALEGKRMAGMIALDVVALQRLVEITGPIETPGFGTLTGDNLVERLVGSYDELDSPEAFLTRNAGQQVLVTQFQSRMLAPTKLVEKFQALGEAADERHLAVFMRDEEEQAAIRELGLDGDLSDTPHGYLGVFNQARVGLKSDYWQRRTVRSDVTLAEDGSAHVRLEVEIFNDSPPPADVFPSFYGYVRRFNDTNVAAFLPMGAEVTRSEVDGEPFFDGDRVFYGRPYVYAHVYLDPRETKTMVLEYDVPQAAVVEGDSLTYHLDVDPQGMVDPEALEVTVHWPEGFAPQDVPDGWTSGGGTTRYSDPDFEKTSSWEITATH